MPRRHRILFATMSCAVLVIALLPGPAAAQALLKAVDPVPLNPSQGDLVTGPQEFTVRQPHQLGPDGPFVTQISFFDVYVDGEGQEVRQFLDFDDVGVDPDGLASRCDLWDCAVPGVWSFVWEPDPRLPTGPHHIELEVFVCPQPNSVFEECEFGSFPGFDIVLDLTPPTVDLEGEDEITVVDAGAPVRLRAVPNPDGDVQLVAWTFAPYAFVFGKGLPRKDQHTEGAAVSGDLDGDGETGDASCAPTAMGSSLSWFAENDEDAADLLPEGDTAAEKMRALVTMLGDDMDTDGMGSTLEEIKKGTEDYLEGVGLGEDFDVESDDDASAAEVVTEFGRGQDVTLGLTGGGWGHFVAVERIVRLTTGETIITVMDPWTGGLIPITVDATGQASYTFPWQGEDDDPVDVDMVMVHVSPTGEGGEPVNGGGFAGPAGEGNTGEELMWDTADIPVGRYLIRATATDSTGLSTDAYQVIDLVGSDADLATTNTGAQRGDLIDWEATVVNNGPDDATGVQVTDVIADSDTFVEASEGCAVVDGTVVCDIGDLPAGDSASVTVTTRFDPGHPSVANTAVATQDGGDPVVDNDGDTANIVIDLGAIPGPVGPQDPISTAVAISRERFRDADPPTFAGAQPAAAFVVLSRDDEFADSLAGSVLTGGAPLLFTPTGALDVRTAAEIDRVLGGVGTVYVLGGTAAIGDDVAQALTDGGYTVQRLAGPTRVQTALEIAGQARAIGDTDAVMIARDRGPDGNPTAGWADSITGGGYAADTGTPVVVTPTAGLHEDVQAWLDDDAPTQVILLGGTMALSEAVADALPGAERVAGANRAATAVLVATELWEQPSDGPRSYVISSGTDEFGWAYGLAGAGLAADGDSPILLSDASVNPPETLAAVDGCLDEPVALTAVGPASALPAAIVAELDARDEDACA